MNATLCQINTTPGDFEGNFAQVCQCLKEAHKESDIIIFPELTLPGYLCKDLMYEKDFVQRNLYFLQQIIAATCDISAHVVIGYIDQNKTGSGKPFTNMLAVIYKGMIVGTYQKRLLPNYDVFDEGRYFEPGNSLLVLDLFDHKIGMAICEDLWNSCKGETNLINYKNDPVKLYKEIGVDTIISINSSPFVKGKPRKREEMLQSISSSNDITIIYVNQVGGQDDLVFDGHSAIYNQGRRRCLMNHEPGTRTYTAHEEYSQAQPISWEDPYTIIHDMIVVGLRDYIKKTGFKSVVLGSSGGIDSAVVATLACEAIGPKNVNCIMMPSCYSSEGSVRDAQKLHENLGCNEFKAPIDYLQYVTNIRDGLGLTHSGVDYNPVADENIQSRMRGNIIMYYANAMNALAIGTSNKCESAVGYFTVFGDTANFFNPLIDLYKMEIYALAKYLNRDATCIPQNIIDKAPSAELAPDQKDETSLLPYNILDAIVQLYIEARINNYDDFISIFKVCNVSKIDYYRIISLIRKNEFKRRMVAMGVKLTQKSFGSGRRYPVVCKY